MRFVFYTKSISPHQLPLAYALAAKLGDGEFCYVCAESLSNERKMLGWLEVDEEWIVDEGKECDKARNILANADVLISGLRDFSLFEARAACGRKTIYCSERWFKPKLGTLRLLSPSYFKMAYRFVQLLRRHEWIYYFPMGIHAARDMARLCGLFAGDLQCLCRAPKLSFEKEPGGGIFLAEENVCKNEKFVRRYCLDKMRMWGYYVAPSRNDALPVQEASDTPSVCRVLWVGRLLNWKRVDTIVRAVSAHANLKRVDNSLQKITLDVYGTGPEEKRLKKLAKGYEDIIKFHPPVPIAEVRQLMRTHDVYVLASNAYEGWGAVVSEALEEGMKVIGTYEAGGPATMLMAQNLFHAGDWHALLRLLSNSIPAVGIGPWTAKFAADYLGAL